MHMDISKKSRLALACFCLVTSTLSHALEFKITTKVGTTLPTSVPSGGVTYAYYTVQNRSSFVRQSAYITNLPVNTVTQVTSGGFYDDTCAATFDLNSNGLPGDSCTLQLAIYGSEPGSLINFQSPIVCVASSVTACNGPILNHQLGVRVTPMPSIAWVNSNLMNSVYISDLAILNNNVYVGGFTQGSPLGGGQVWGYLSSTWAPLYSPPQLSSKVDGLFADSGILYSVAGNIGNGQVNTFTPNGSVTGTPTNITGELAATNLNDLDVDSSNLLYVGGANSGGPVNVGDVWVCSTPGATPSDGLCISPYTWVSTGFNFLNLSSVIWLDYVSSTPAPYSTQGLYAAAYSTPFSSSDPVVYVYSNLPPSWSNTYLPVAKMDSLISLNVDPASNTLYAVGSVSTSGVSLGVVMRYNGTTKTWENIPTPNDSQVINAITFSSTGTTNYLYLAGENLRSDGAVWYGNGNWWINTGLPSANEVITLAINNHVLYAGGTDTSAQGAVWYANSPP